MHRVFTRKVFIFSLLISLIGLFYYPLKLTNAVPGPGSSVYRFWSDAYNGHFYTISAQERDYIVANYHDSVWRYEGAMFNAYSSSGAGLKPAYRFWSDSYRHHFYTMNESEKSNIIANMPEWRYEGIAYYAYETSPLLTRSLYRFWSDAYKGHFYTSSDAEKNYVAANYPSNIWRYEGVAFGVADVPPGPIQLLASAPALSIIKSYNGSTGAYVTPGKLYGVIPGDSVTLSASANYETAAVGTGKKITVVYSIGGASASKYTKPANYVATNGEIVSGSGGSGGYPYANSDPNGIDPWRFWYRQCTSYAAWRSATYGPVPSSMILHWGSSHTANGGDWGNLGSTHGRYVSSTPSADAIMSFPYQAGLPYGHVAIVDSVNGDGTVNISEYNWSVSLGFGRRTNVNPAERNAVFIR